MAPDTVLVIDDDPDLRSLMDAIGEICGVRVLQAPDCLSGLKLLDEEHERIKLIFLDYFMPGMEPVKCADAIAARAGQAIPIVLLTAASDAAARAAELKLNQWMSKPFEVSQVTGLFKN